ncbi:hypothetical protein BDN72DRAFT_844510 [Pluteus cervinus]|uniref:Uncharacterized protein n=1 Tax=Pluteus cervinus TaxID=181527 RepID=A0ACD3AL88_9AGAR|nr:hypothetical protein BDN72DRAFT_844510 [Pluteus cervinus]
MPGSLFPRSPSVEPDSIRPDELTERHVRFASISNSVIDTQPNPVSPASSYSRATPIKRAEKRLHTNDVNGSSPSIHPDSIPSPLRRPLKPQISVKRHAGTMPGDLSLSTKERQLNEAKQTQRENRERRQHQPSNESPYVQEIERERAEDKERIRILEEEVTKLREELSNRPVRNNPVHLGFDHPPPPPPPPPPLPRQSAPLRIPYASSTPGSVFRSIRASLKPMPTPVEAPINPPARRQGHPTVGLPPDLMASFLSELKTVRLRKVSGPPGTRTESSRPSSSFNVTAYLAETSSTGRFRSSDDSTPWAESSRVGAKRKREDVSQAFREASSTGPALKRISLSTSLDSDSYASRAQDKILFAPPLSKHPQINPTFQSGTTPSLCSDNSLEREDDTQFDEPPSTPSTGPLLSFPQESHADMSLSDLSGQEIIDVDLLPDEPANLQGRLCSPPFIPPPLSSIPDSPQQSKRVDLFARRPPASPLPAPSPRKPLPPRATRVVTPYASHLSESEPDDDRPSFSTHSLSHPSIPRPAERVHEYPPPSTAGTKPRRIPSSSRIPVPGRITTTFPPKQQRTLDEELRTVPDHELKLADLELDMLSSAGTRPKNLGFLAHGGAGGPAVFMGVGYVDGAQPPKFVAEGQLETNTALRKGRSKRDRPRGDSDIFS